MDRNIRAITNFIFFTDKLEKADLIIVPGTYREQIVETAYEAFKKGLAKIIITTGAAQEGYEKSEAEFQKEYLIKRGVPQNLIFTETKSANTKESAEFALKLIKKLKLKHNKIILVSKNYHARRILMTFKRFFPKSKILIFPTIDDRNITSRNWFKSTEKSKVVMGEVEKIGKYFIKGDLSL